MTQDLCERTIALHEGEIAANGPPRKLLCDQELMQRTGLELPLRLNCQHTSKAGAIS